MNKDELYINESGETYAVLVSPGWGAGWSTWNDQRLALDKRVVELFLSGYRVTDSTEDGDRLMKECGYDEPYWGGWNQINVVWIPFGVKWRMIEYDGSETIEYLNEDSYICFNK